MMSAAILLAAGASTRLGRPKQLVHLGGEALLVRSIRISRDAGLHPLVVVLPAARPDLIPPPSADHLILVENPASPDGMSTSIHAGVRALAPLHPVGAVLLACDQPAITAAHLHGLTLPVDRITASRYRGRNGIPAYFPAVAFPMLLALTGDKGARDLLATAASLDLPDGDLDIDTEADLARARRLFPG